MTSTHTPQTRWPTGFRIRPPADPAAGDIEVADTVTGRVFSWPADQLADCILAGETDTATAADWQDAFAPSAQRAELVPDWQHWQRRGWHPSDQFYVASRRADAATDPAPAVAGPPPPSTRPDGPVLRLDAGLPPGRQGMGALLVNRRSGRTYVPKPTALDVLAGFLRHGFAELRARRAAGDDAGSAWDVLLCVFNVEGLDAGTYYYDLQAHELVGIRPGDHRAAMQDVLQGMHSPRTAAWTLGLVADFPRYQRHNHGEQALRRLYLEVGVLGQELILLGSSYGLSTLVTPAQKDRPYLALHGLSDRRHAPVYTLTMGRSAGNRGVYFNDLQVGRGEPPLSQRT